MPLSHVSKVFAVKDAKIDKLLTDPGSGAATYGPALDVPGIKTVSVGGDVFTAELRGDNTRLDYQAGLSGIEVSFDYAKLSLDVLAVWMGGAVTDAGVAPSQTADYELTADNAAFSYFRFRAVSAAADSPTGDVLLTLHKCILSEFPEGLGMEEEDYRTFSTSAAAVPLLGTKRWLSVSLRETAAPIA